MMAAGSTSTTRNDGAQAWDSSPCVNAWRSPAVGSRCAARRALEPVSRQWCRSPIVSKHQRREGHMSEGTIRVVLADDHTVVRAGLKAVLSAARDIHVIGEAQDG